MQLQERKRIFRRVDDVGTHPITLSTGYPLCRACDVSHYTSQSKLARARSSMRLKGNRFFKHGHVAESGMLVFLTRSMSLYRRIDVRL